MWKREFSVRYAAFLLDSHPQDTGIPMDSHGPLA